MCRILMDKIKLVNFTYKADNGLWIKEVAEGNLGGAKLEPDTRCYALCRAAFSTALHSLPAPVQSNSCLK